MFVSNILWFATRYGSLKAVVRLAPVMKDDGRFHATPEQSEVRQTKEPQPTFSKPCWMCLIAEQRDECSAHIVGVFQQFAAWFRLGPNRFHEISFYQHRYRSGSNTPQPMW